MSPREPPRAKAAPRAARTTDVTRPRSIALAALGAALGAAAVIALGRTPLGGKRALAKPHVAAKLACATCHEPPATAGAAASTSAPGAIPGATPAPAPLVYASGAACKTCHAAAQHASARAPHRALAAKGELACATCHPAHAGAQGVSFGAGGSFVRWSAGAEAPPVVQGAGARAGTTVPLVALRACATCHDLARASDPASACVAPEVRSDLASGRPRSLAETPSLCFDEHKTLATAGDRFVAWDAAREAATSTPWVKAETRSDPPWLPLGGALGGGLALGLVATTLERRRRTGGAQGPAGSRSGARPSGGSAGSPALPAANRRLPVIDTSTCLGCYACVDACPFDVLTVERYVAVVARPEECCGVVLCEQVCPNGSLQIDEGEPIEGRPLVDGHLESRDVPGLFVAGDLTGLPLIKNAINQGVHAIDRIAATLPRRRTGRVDVDVVVVGAGPAGLSAALRAKEKGLSCVVLEQASIAASIRSFPRDKIVYDPPLDLPVEGELWLKEATKDELLAQWSRIVRARSLDVCEGLRVTSLAKDGDAFAVTARRDGGEDEHLRAARVVLAIGRRGTPRTLDLEVAPGAEDRVAYTLADARSFEGKRVVIAGLGDAAMEAAIALARQPGTHVTVAYRGDGFKRGKARNVAEVKQLVTKGKVRVLFETVPVAITKSAVTLAGTGRAEGRRSVRCDALLVLIGGVPSWDLLTRAGIVRPGKASTDR